jgi:hypothetical protein
MSRYYEMRVEVRGSNKDKLAAIKATICQEWNITDSYTNGETEEAFSGEGNLGGGESEEDFTQRVSRAIWEANGEYCEVGVTAVYLEDPPTQYHQLKESDYDSWRNNGKTKEQEEAPTDN